jgi:hypothetical protein
MLLIVGYQTWLMMRQTEIVEKQDKLLARRAVLTARANKVKTEGDRITYSIVVVNLGEKGASGYHWNLLIPPLGGPVVGLGADGAEVSDAVTIDGATFIPHRGYAGLPLFPSLRQELGLKIQIRRRDPGEKIEVPILWRIAAEDGVFPEGAIRPDGSAGVLGRLVLDGR